MTEEQIQLEAIAAYPKEAVWLVTESGTYQVENIHEQPEEFFAVSLQDTLAAQENGLLRVIHSHCDGHAVPSAADMRTQMLMGVPWGVLNTNGEVATGIQWWGEDSIPSLEGRSFIHAISDCYSLVRDYYRLQGREVEDVPRDWQWWESSDLLSESFSGLGFVEISASEAREGDAWISQMRNLTPHHCGIILDNDLILHHPGSGYPVDQGKLSVIEPIYRYLPYIVKYVRLL